MDFPLLELEWGKWIGKPFPSTWIFVDSFRLIERTHPGLESYALANLATEKIDHTALGDATALLGVLKDRYGGPEAFVRTVRVHEDRCRWTPKYLREKTQKAPQGPPPAPTLQNFPALPFLGVRANSVRASLGSGPVASPPPPPPPVVAPTKPWTFPPMPPPLPTFSGAKTSPYFAAPPPPNPAPRRKWEGKERVVYAEMNTVKREARLRGTWKRCRKFASFDEGWVKKFTCPEDALCYIEEKEFRLVD
jgi:hypothetical protein